MAFMLPIIKNDHPLPVNPKVRRPSISLTLSSRKASFTFGENRSKNFTNDAAKTTANGRQKSKSVSNDQSLIQTRIELQTRIRPNTSSCTDESVASTSSQLKVPKVS